MFYFSLLKSIILVNIFFSQYTSYAFDNYTKPEAGIPGLELDKKTQLIRERFDTQFVNGRDAANQSEIITLSTLEDFGSFFASLTYNDSEITFNEFQPNASVKFTLNYKSLKPIIVSISGESLYVGKVRNDTCFILPKTDGTLMKHRVNVPLDINYLGKVYMNVWIKNATTLADNVTNFKSIEVENYWDYVDNETSSSVDPLFGIKAIVIREFGIVQKVFKVLIIIFIVILTFLLGCDLDFKIILEILKRPFGPIIGFSCQYVIMPVIAFLLGYFVPISKEFAFGLFVVGCCPGGGGSNVWCLLLGGDINLSMTMTFISTVTAIFMLPFLLFIFGRFFIDTARVQIPYVSILTQLIGFIIPVGLSLLLKWKRPKIAEKFARHSKKVALGFIIFVLSVGIWANISIIRQIGFYSILIPIGALLPYGGFSLSCLISWILRQPYNRIITIGIEAAIQNVGIAFTILLYSMKKPDGELGAVMPYITALFTPLPFYFMLAYIKIKECIKTKCGKYEESEKKNIPFDH